MSEEDVGAESEGFVETGRGVVDSGRVAYRKGTLFHLLNESDLAPSGDPAVSRRRLEEAVLVDSQGEAVRMQILEFLDTHGTALADRSILPGHLTGSALVVDSEGERVLLMLHAKLGRWLQPGGHADGDHELAGVALREAAEETGIEGMKVLVPAIDVDIHEIPARGSDPAHLHLDLRFVVLAPPGARLIANHESRDLRWVDPNEVSALSREVGLHRLVSRGMAAYLSSGLQELNRNPSGSPARRP